MSWNKLDFFERDIVVNYFDVYLVIAVIARCIDDVVMPKVVNVLAWSCKPLEMRIVHTLVQFVSGVFQLLRRAIWKIGWKLPVLRLTPESICQIRKEFDGVGGPKVVAWKVDFISEMYYLNASNIDYKAKTLAAVEIRI